MRLKAANGHLLYPVSPAPVSLQDETYRLLSLPIEFDGRQLGSLEVSIDIEALLSSQLGQIHHLERLLLLVLLSTIVLAALLQDRWIRRPLKTLADATTRIADGDFDLVFPKASSRDEVGTLIRTFDTMRTKLANRGKKLEEQHALLDTIRTAQAGFITDADDNVLFEKLLVDIIALTGSECGFIGEIDHRDDEPFLKTFAICSNAENDGQNARSESVQILSDIAITGEEPIISNHPEGDPRLAGMPEGHPPMDAFLGIPLLRNGRVIGMIGMANRPGGYDNALVEYLEPVTSTCSHIVEALKTERKRILVEEQVREREVRMRTIFENVVDGIITTNERGEIESFNQAAEKMFGYSAEEVFGKNVSILIPAPHRDKHDKYIDRYLDGAKSKMVGTGREVEAQRKDGSTFPIDIAVNVMWVGEVRFFCSIMRDITERKKIDRMKNEFVSTVSHELRTPLTSIRGSLGLLTGGAAGELPEQARSLLEIAGNNTERLLLLINDILDTEKIESGQMAFKFQNVTVMEFLQQAVEANESYASQQNVRLKLTHCCGGDNNIYADPHRLMQVMNNLLSNAVKFSPEEATVEVATICREGMIRISVTDHGTGIPEEFQPKLFDKFTQSDASDTRKIGGTGLGMNITKAIVEKHGGKIAFATQEGIGTTFYFDLPVMLSLSDGDKLGEIAAGAGHTDSRVLIVEDDQNVASLLRIMLAQAGFEADIALDAQRAKQLLQENQYSIVTMDIMLPDQDGISLIRELREQESTQHLPIIVVSAKADVARRELSGGAMSVVDWLGKPIDQGRLLSVINQLTVPSNSPVILHVEDEPDINMIVSTLLKGTARVVWARTLHDAREHLSHSSFDLALLDVSLPDGSAIQLLDTLNQHSPPIPTVMFSARDIDESLAEQVSAALVKSKTSNADLVDTIKSLLSNTQPGADPADTSDEHNEEEFLEVNKA